MSNAKYTQGPWFVGAQNDGLYIIDSQPSPAPYDGPIPRDHGPNVIATPNFRLAECEANARLIAAAPDLLAALQARIDLSAYQGDDADGFVAHVEALEVAAIAKAVQS